MNKAVILIIIFFITILCTVVVTRCVIETPLSPQTVITNTDTIVEYKYDTIVYEKPKYVYKTKIDTQIIFINKKDSVYLPIEQKWYSEKDKYDIWVSGYEPNLDSVKIYPKTIKESVKTTETKEKTNVYATLGFMTYSGAFIPEIGISITTKGKWLIGAKIGYYDKNLVYGATLGYKLGKKQ